MAALAGTNTSSARPGSKRAPILAALTVAIAAALTLNRLGAADVCGANEAVEGVFVQQMVEHGKLLFPLENGRSPMYKPPLFHWTATALDRLAGIGKVTATSLRLAAALYAIAGVILSVCFSWDFLGGAGAILAGLILCGSYQYIEQGRIGRVDMTLCFFETLALFTFMWWYAPRVVYPSASAQGLNLFPPPFPDTGEGKSGGGWSTSWEQPVERGERYPDAHRHGALPYLFALALGLGVLAKGPVGTILPATACGIFLVAESLLLTRGRPGGGLLRDFRKLAAPGPVLLAIVVGGSWYAVCLFARRYGFLDRQIGSENFGRFFGALGAMPPWYYVKPLLLNSIPLSLMAPVAVYFALQTYWQGPSEPGSSSASAKARDAVRLLAIFWLLSVAFFTMAAYKRRAYLLPLWPASAVMLAWCVEMFSQKGRLAGHLLRGFVVASSSVLIVFNAVYLPRNEVRQCAGDSLKDAAREIDRIVGRSEPLYLYGFGEDPAPLLFYLDRDAPRLTGKLGDAPPGYVVVPAEVWRQHKEEALDLTPIFQSSSGRPPVVLLRYGKALAAGQRPYWVNYKRRCPSFDIFRSSRMKTSHRFSGSAAALSSIEAAVSWIFSRRQSDEVSFREYPDQASGLDHRQTADLAFH